MIKYEMKDISEKFKWERKLKQGKQKEENNRIKI
jgi:hypothetical protein